MLVGGATVNCTNGFPSSLSNGEDSSLRQRIDSSITRGFYLFPELQFYCEANIRRVRGYFVVDAAVYAPFYLQIWREQNGSGSLIRVQQISLDLSTHCQYNDNDNEQCYIDYMIPHELKVEADDFIGFYTYANTLARPLFSSSTSNTTVYLLISRSNIDRTNIENKPSTTLKILSIFYRPQVIGKLML